MSTELTEPTSLRSTLSSVARGILALVLLILLFQFVDIRSVTAAFVRADSLYLLGGALLVTANIGLQMAKWRYFVRLINPDNSTKEIAASLLFGISLGTITPGQIGEFGGRALRHHSLPAGSVLGLTLVDKLQMMCVLGVGGVVGLVQLYQLPPSLSLLTVATALIIGFFLFFWSNALPGVLHKIAPRSVSRRFFNEFFAAMTVFHPKDLLISLFLSVAFYGVLFAQMYLFLNAFEPVSVWKAFPGFASMMFLKSLVPISLGDLGVREATSAYFFSLSGVAESTAIGAALLLFMTNILLPSLAGLYFTPRVLPK